MPSSSSTKSSGKSSNTSKISTSNTSKSTSSSAPKRKLSSMTSFQPTLNFKTSPKLATTFSPSSSSSSSTSSRPSASSSSSSFKDEVDRKLMPPPPPGIKLKPSVSPQKGTIGDLKGKEKEIIIIDDEDEERNASYPYPDEVDTAQMWTDLYGPTHETELAPGKARIARVKNWIHESIYGYPFDIDPTPGTLNTDKIRKYKRILFLSGPAGVGKTTTVKLLCESLGVEMMEWGESVEEWSLGAGIDRESAISKFNSFISRNSFPSLSMSSQLTSAQSQNIKPRIILLTALPHLSHMPTREAFHASLLTFCQNFNKLSCPMVIVHSDAGSGGRAEESWMDRERGGREGSLEVLGREVRDGPWCQEIDFLSLAPTFLNKALMRVLQTAVPRALDRPSHATVKLIALSSNGDLRSAINTLQMLCSGRKEVKGRKRKAMGEDEEDQSESRKRGGGKGSRGGKGAKLDVNKDLRAVLDAVTRNEQSLNLFHALGRVFYNKRLDDPNMEDEDQELLDRIRKLPSDEPLPSHLQQFTRRKSLVQVESFIPTIPIDASSFALWLHQSFPNYCSDIEEVSAGLDELCSADIMRTDDDIWQSSSQAISYALHLSVRGLLISLPSPVPRRSQKVNKPHFFESYKLERDNTSALAHVAGYITRKGIVASNAFADGDVRDEGVWGGMIDKRVLAGDLVPMMVKLQGLSGRPILPSSAQTLCLPLYSSLNRNSMELTAKDDVDMDEEYEASIAENDGLDFFKQQQAWDDELDQKEEENDWLLDDDIDDFD
ncbi:uncharacterized protein I206_103195 [Kwoniella pini CBS 10737]|uniref:Cell cycle checkpoint protein n=1 Tax=Kwoniella pini CBS 10737 TaxID=1296096 RepID=A0A1B9IAR7_9TREE|nr:uncharacterized protein I206_01801 [Kwoniella pini CBS 10737]OCF52511.1 hypothetical protein I206_01801 [Kwoniella pini CBS 10737]